MILAFSSYSAFLLRIKRILINKRLGSYLTIIKDTYRESIPTNKAGAYEKYEYVYLGNWYSKSTICKKFLHSNNVFKKNKVVSGKSPFLVKGPFCAHHSICLNIGF